MDKEAVEAANKVKVIPNIKPGNVVQLKVVSFCLLLCLSFLSYILFDILEQVALKKLDSPTTIFTLYFFPQNLVLSQLLILFLILVAST